MVPAARTLQVKTVHIILGLWLLQVKFIP
jgi:hypothetical protein